MLGLLALGRFGAVQHGLQGFYDFGGPSGDEFRVRETGAGRPGQENEQRCIAVVQASCLVELLPEPLIFSGCPKGLKVAFGLKPKVAICKGQHLAPASCVQVRRAGFVGQVVKVEAIVILGPTQSRSALVDVVAQLAAAQGSFLGGAGMRL